MDRARSPWRGPINTLTVAFSPCDMSALSSEQPVCVLVVDDHDDTALLAQRILSSDTCRVFTAESYKSAMELARHERVDVLLTDIGLLDGDGCALLAEVRAYSPSVRSIALTGHSQPSDRQRYVHAGFDQVLIKPVNIDDLQTAVAAMTGAASGDHSRADPGSSHAA
jgi:CheY-like chemotaxis protein